MTDEQGDPYRRHAQDSGDTTPGSDSSHGGYADDQPVASDDGPNRIQDHGTNAAPPVEAEPEMSPAVLK